MIRQRRAEIVLVLPDGVVIGRLPPIPIATPWWQDIGPVVEAVRRCCGMEITVLRLLAAEFNAPPGGTVTYLAETPRRVAVEPWHGTLDAHPLRLPYAIPGGPAADVAWALSKLDAQGLRPSGAPVQIRTWNLSSLWRIPVGASNAWLKVTPAFLAPEGNLLELLAGARVPRLLGRYALRCLL